MASKTRGFKYTAVVLVLGFVLLCGCGVVASSGAETTKAEADAKAAAADAELNEEDNKWCSACEAVVEISGLRELDNNRDRGAVQAACFDKDPSNPHFSQCTADGVTKLVEKRLTHMCEQAPLKDMSAFVQQVCRELIGEHKQKLVSAWTTGAVVMDRDQIWSQKKEVCHRARFACSTDDFNVTTPCLACSVIARDAWSVLNRYEGTKKYRTPKHVWDVMEELCTTTSLHHHQDTAIKLQPTCDDMLESYEGVMSKALKDPKVISARGLAQKLCKQGARMCKGKDQPAFVQAPPKKAPADPAPQFP